MLLAHLKARILGIQLWIKLKLRILVWLKNPTTYKSLYKITRQSGNMVVITRIRSVSENMMPLHHTLTVLLPQNPLSGVNAAMPNTSVLLRWCWYLRGKEGYKHIKCRVSNFFLAYFLFLVLFCTMPKTHIHT